MVTWSQYLQIALIIAICVLAVGFTFTPLRKFTDDAGNDAGNERDSK